MRRAGDVCFSQVFHEGSGKMINKELFSAMYNFLLHFSCMFAGGDLEDE